MVVSHMKPLRSLLHIESVGDIFSTILSVVQCISFPFRCLSSVIMSTMGLMSFLLEFIRELVQYLYIALSRLPYMLFGQVGVEHST